MIADAEKNRFKLVTSVITIAEVWHAKAEIDGKAPDPDVERMIASLWHPDASPIWLVDVHEVIVRDAAKLLRQGIQHGWRKTKGVDGVHLVTAKREGVQEFWTTDGAMKKWEPIVGYKVCTPHYEGEEKQLELGEQPESEAGNA